MMLPSPKSIRRYKENGQKWTNTSLFELSINDPPNIADIHSQLQISSGLWAFMVPSSNLNVTSAMGTKKQACCKSVFMHPKNVSFIWLVNQRLLSLPTAPTPKITPAFYIVKYKASLKRVILDVQCFGKFSHLFKTSCINFEKLNCRIPRWNSWP